MKRIAAFAVLAVLATSAQAQLYGHVSAGGDTRFAVGAGYRASKSHSLEFNFMQADMKTWSQRIEQNSFVGRAVFHMPVAQRAEFMIGGGLAYVDQTTASTWDQPIASATVARDSGIVPHGMVGVQVAVAPDLRLRLTAEGFGGLGGARGARAVMLGFSVGF